MHLVLSTADASGKPWVTPVAYNFDNENSLYWESSKNSRHSTNIRARKEIAIVIYMFKPSKDALYIEAEAKELVDEAEIAQAIDVINTRPSPEKYRIKKPSDVSGPASWRIYKAVPKITYVRKGIVTGGQAITVRRKIASH